MASQGGKVEMANGTYNQMKALARGLKVCEGRVGVDEKAGSDGVCRRRRRADRVMLHATQAGRVVLVPC